MTKHTMQFGTKPPVRAFYSPPDSFDQERGIVPDADSPAFTPATHALTYEHVDGLDLLLDENTADPEKIYYRCPARRPHG